LTLHTPNKFYKAIGPIVIGLELIRLPFNEEYRPHFVMYPLFGNKMGDNIKDCFNSPIVLIEFSNKKGGQFSIPYTKHSNYFSEVTECIKNQIPIPFDKDIPLKKILSVIDHYSNLQAGLHENKLKIALVINNDQEVDGIMKQISTVNWNTTHFKACGADVNTWYQGLQKIIANRDNLINIVERNKEDKKISNYTGCSLMI
jgi:hypothetical protein